MTLLFTPKNKEKLKEFILNNSKNKFIFNFLNLYSVYLYKKDKEFKQAIDSKSDDSLTLIDGSIISFFLNEQKLRGTNFSRFLINNLSLLNDKKHFFIGLTDDELNIITTKSLLNRKNIKVYNPPYITNNKFSDREIKKMVNLINKTKVNYLWIGIGNPKQEILASDLYDKIDVNFIFNVGAAFDFILGKKKEAPKLIQKLGIEWLYRFTTDFKHSNKKVYKSFVGLFYLPTTIGKNK